MVRLVSRTIFNEKDMMRKLFFGILTALILAACSSDPVYHGMTPQQKEDYSKAIAGIYEGNTLLQDFNDFWQDNEFGYLTYFQLNEE